MFYYAPAKIEFVQTSGLYVFTHIIIRNLSNSTIRLNAVTPCVTIVSLNRHLNFLWLCNTDFMLIYERSVQYLIFPSDMSLHIY